MSNATWLSEIPQLDRKQLLEIRKTLDGAYRDFSREYGDTIESLFDPLLSFLIWFEKLLLSSPWWLIIGILVGLAYVASRSWKLSASVGIAFFVIGFFGMWDNTMRTMSIILVSTMLAIASGYPPGSSWLSPKSQSHHYPYT
ncbi:L-proline glycine betaine ABC transport system permease protein ProW [Vibrio variabilis]|uniref:L-proline glycine betaine ABC transport system permease protein ProW n=1 Tax=Vibrio variabilis TaxID=990271 RepID=A0ABQ0JMU5_9VIBR|nr:L-proline glycine betaine ABC transport system permease protein ProW [Vibrio variabilis]